MAGDGMDIGKLQHRITFQKPVINTDENRVETQSWQNHKSVWSHVSNLHGKEYFEAAAVQKEKIIKFIVRALADIDESMRIVFQDKIYNIIFIDHIKYEKRHMEIKALEVTNHEHSD